MRSWCSAVAVTAVLAFLLSACGQTSPVTPVSPPRPVETFPSILGDWLGSGTVTMTNRADHTITGSFACIQTWSFNSQDGGAFSGTMNSTGQNPGSDRFCTVGGTNVTGVLTSDGAISSLRLIDGIDASGCTRVLGDDVFTGELTSTTTFTLRLSDRWRCFDPVTYDADRTVTLSATLRFR